MKPNKVAAYLRVSTQDQSLELQRNEIENYCKSRGWSDVVFYEDFGFSGAKFSNRDGYRKLVKDARSRKFDTLIVFKLDRIGRSLIDVVSFLHELQELGIVFIALRDSIDLSTSSGKLLTSLIASFAEYERNIIRERTIAGLAVAKKRGKIFGRPKRRDDIAIAELRTQGLSIQQIANRLQTSKGSVQASLAAHTKNVLKT